MDSAVFRYSPGWQISAIGADPAEPQDPARQPSGTLTFSYTGDDLYLLLVPGNYWAYLFVTVDGQPANQLPVIPGNMDSTGHAAGYKPLLAPERAPDSPALPLLVHRSTGASTHEARLEIWRGWGQIPLRGVAVDPWAAGSTRLCNGSPLLLAALPAILGVWCLGMASWLWYSRRPLLGFQTGQADWLDRWSQSRVAWLAAGAGVAFIGGSILLGQWWMCLPGLALVGVAGMLRPALWMGALLFGLPFAYGIKLPLLPTRSFDLIDIGVWGGVAILLAYAVLAALAHTQLRPAGRIPAFTYRPLFVLAAVVSWGLIAALAAPYSQLALREWRVVFLNPLVFGATLAALLQFSRQPDRDRWLLAGAWLAGAAGVSLFGLWGYAVGNDLVSQAEGVRRVQAFYGSGNNLALYLDRTLAVSLALALFTNSNRRRLLWSLFVLPQAAAWLLTFSKGSLVLAAPAITFVLLAGGNWLLGREGRSRRPLWLLLGLCGLGTLALLPFLGTERFQRLLDFDQGTGFLRLQLWRSAWQMALDHPLLGVGPDHFLYVYRSGYMLPSAWQEPNLNHPHNLLLDWWTRLGLPGLVLGLTWLVAGSFTVLRWLRHGPDRVLALGVLAAVAAGLAHGLIDVSYALPDLMLVWVLLFGIAPLSSSNASATT